MYPPVVRAALLGLAAVPSMLLATDLYPGPAYDFNSGSGWTSPVLALQPGGTSGDGFAVGSFVQNAFRSAVTRRGFRWDASAAAPVQLAPLPGNDTAISDVYATNTTGTVVGFSQKFNGSTSLGFRPVRWDPGSTVPTELANLGTTPAGNTTGQAFAVNAAGTAVGYAEKFNGNTSLGVRPVRWNAGGTAATELATLEPGTGYTEALPRAVNAAGTAVGFANKSGTRAVRWNAGGTAATELGTLGTTNFSTVPNYTEAQAWAVNTGGTAVGYAIRFVNGGIAIRYRAVRWDAGTTVATDLGTLGVGTGGGGYPEASSINASGVIGGYARKYVNGTLLGDRAVQWDAGSVTPIELGNLGTTLDGSANSQAYAVNAAGTLVGYAEKWSNGDTLDSKRAVLWGQNGLAVDLNTLLSPTDATLWTLTAARGISDTNWVSGVGDYDPDASGPLPSYSRAFLMQVPEPAMLGVLGAVAGMLLRRGKSDRRTAANRRG